MATSRQIKGLDSLDKEIRRLRGKAKLLEKSIDEQFVYLQHHSGSLLVNSLFPRKTEEQMSGEGFSVGGKLLYALLQNDGLRRRIGRLAVRLGERVGDGLNRLIDRLFRE